MVCSMRVLFFFDVYAFGFVRILFDDVLRTNRVWSELPENENVSKQGYDTKNDKQNVGI